MKKVKIMLSAVAIVAVVGGALAFKANKGALNFCVKAGSGSSGTCTATFIQSKIDPLAASYWTTTYDGTDCLAKTCNQTRIRLSKN